MTRKELVCVLRDYAKMTEEPPTGRAIEGQEEIMRRAADMIEKSVEIDTVLEIIDEAAADYGAVPTEIDVGRKKAVISFEKKDGMLAMASMIRVLVLGLRGEE